MMGTASRPHDDALMPGIQCVHAPPLGAMLRRLNEASNSTGMSAPGWGLHPLPQRELKRRFSVKVSGNWRMTFKFDGTDCWSAINELSMSYH